MPPKPKTVYKVDGTEAQNQAINAVAAEFEVTTEQLQAIVDQFVVEMRKGLDHEGATGISKQAFKVRGVLTFWQWR